MNKRKFLIGVVLLLIVVVCVNCQSSKKGKIDGEVIYEIFNLENSFVTCI